MVGSGGTPGASRPMFGGILRSAAAMALMGGLIVGVGVNLVEFGSIDANSSRNYRAIHAYPYDDIFRIGFDNNSSIRLRVGPFFYFGALFEGATVYLPASGVNSALPFEDALRAFGRPSTVLTADYDFRSIVDLRKLSEYLIDPSLFAPTEKIAGSLKGRVAYYVANERSVGPIRFVIVAPDGHPGRDRFFAFVDLRLLDEQIRLEVIGA